MTNLGAAPPPTMQDLRHGRRVALKVLRPELAAALSHPHIVPLHGATALELTFIAVEPAMDPLRGDPRFRRRLQRINLPT